MNDLVDSEQFEAMLRQNGIPPRPAALEIIAREMRGDAPNLNVLERELQKDVAIAGGLIKVANSAYFGSRRHVRSVRAALELLGLRAAAQIVACVALEGAFPSLKLERFWDASFKVAALSAWLVKHCQWRGVNSQDAYTFGLFRDCGIAILMQRMPSYVDVLREANEEAVQSFTEVEQRVLPVAHTQLGAMLTQTWWLPDDITEAIRSHHDARSVAPVSADVEHGPVRGALIAVAQLAEYLLQQATQLSLTKEWEKLGSACMNRLQLDESDIRVLQQEVGSAILSL
jgi:HD-like signal output (HDOD) protein